MTKPPQKRTQQTRGKLIDAAQAIIATKGYAAMRVEDVVQAAGVAKGTFFAHFRDKDALMDLIIGQEINRLLDALSENAVPQSVPELVNDLLPLMRYMTVERYVFDVILRHSGAAAKEEIGHIALTFERQIKVLDQWLGSGHYRNDVPPVLLAEGLQAFMVQTMALHFCAVNNVDPMPDRLRAYLDAWLMPTRQ